MKNNGYKHTFGTMKKAGISIIIALMAFGAFAQQDAMMSQYMFAGLALNPAYAGSHKFYNATLLARKQWTGFPGAPLSQVLSYDGPVEGKNVGLGVLLANDKIGVSNNTELYGNYAYHVGLNDQVRLSLGLRGGISYYSAKLTDLTYWDQDAVFQEDIRGTVMPNFGFGAYLYSNHYYVGLSVPHLINYDPETTLNLNFKNTPRLIRHYYATAGVLFHLSGNLLLKPSFLIKYAPNAPLGIDLNANLLIDKRVWVGASYRFNDAVVGIIEFVIDPKFKVGYAYDYSISLMGNYSGGSHELVLSYDFGKEVYKMKSPRFF